MKLTAAALIIFAPFLSVGVVLAAVFGSQHRRIGRLYAADLLGGACGAVLGSVVLTQALGFAATAKGAAWLALAALCLI